MNTSPKFTESASETLPLLSLPTAGKTSHWRAYNARLISSLTRRWSTLRASELQPATNS